MPHGQTTSSLRRLPRAILLGLAVWYGSQMLAGPLLMWVWVALKLRGTLGCVLVTFGVPILAGVVSAVISYRRGVARLPSQPPTAPV